MSISQSYHYVSIYSNQFSKIYLSSVQEQTDLYKLVSSIVKDLSKELVCQITVKVLIVMNFTKDWNSICQSSSTLHVFCWYLLPFCVFVQAEFLIHELELVIFPFAFCFHLLYVYRFFLWLLQFFLEYSCALNQDQEFLWKMRGILKQEALPLSVQLNSLQLKRFYQLHLPIEQFKY